MLKCHKFNSLSKIEHRREKPRLWCMRTAKMQTNMRVRAVLISVFVIRSLESVIAKLFTCKVPAILVDSLAVSLTWAVETLVGWKPWRKVFSRRGLYKLLWSITWSYQVPSITEAFESFLYRPFVSLFVRLGLIQFLGQIGEEGMLINDSRASLTV